MTDLPQHMRHNAVNNKSPVKLCRPISLLRCRTDSDVSLIRFIFDAINYEAVALMSQKYQPKLYARLKLNAATGFEPDVSQKTKKYLHVSAPAVMLYVLLTIPAIGIAQHWARPQNRKSKRLTLQVSRSQYRLINVVSVEK